MDNYLSHRWPGTSSGQPNRPSPHRLRRERRRRRLRLALTISCSVLAFALLVGGSYWGVAQLAQHLADGPAADSRPQISRDVSQPKWSQDELPWGDPDPTVQLSLSEDSAGGILTPKEIYQQVLPSVVAVEADCGHYYGSGSGVIVTRSGYVITNYHVIDNSTGIQVMLLSDESVYDAAVIGFDEDLDLAVLKIDAQDLTPARLGNSDRLSVGDPVYAIGNPMGYLYGSMTEGIVSSPIRAVSFDTGDMNLIQISAPINSGNSGGALVNAQGQVVGITSAKITGIEDDDTVIEGLGLAIPITDSLTFLNHILATGKSVRPALGITCAAAEVDGHRGVRVATVDPGTSAAAVLQADDLILTANGVETPKLYPLSRVLYQAGAGGAVELCILRDGERLTVTVELFDRLAE